MISRTYDLIDFVEIKLCKGFPNLLLTTRGRPCPMQPPRSPRAIKAKRQLDASSPSDQLTMSGVIDQSVILLKDTTLVRALKLSVAKLLPVRVWVEKVKLHFYWKIVPIAISSCLTLGVSQYHWVSGYCAQFLKRRELSLPPNLNMDIAVAVISMYVQHSSVSLRKIVWEFPGGKQWSGSEGMPAASSHLEVEVFVGDESWPRAINQGIRNQVYSCPHQSIIAKWLKQVVNLATVAWHQLNE